MMINNIQFLRGLAALLVLMHHALPHFKAMNLSFPIFEFIAKFGYVGVDIFFVISGYVMAKTTLGKNQNINNSLEFIKKRFLRVFLGYWPIFGLAIVYFYCFKPGFLSSKEVLQSFFLVNSNMFDLVIAPSWSLTYELYFYLIISILLLTPKIKPIPVLASIIVLIIIKNSIVGFDTNKYLNFFLSTVIIEFIAGYMLYFFRKLILSKQWIPVTFILFISMYLFTTLLDMPFDYPRLVTFGLFSMTLVWFFVLIEEHDFFTFTGVFKKVGDSSYTLYLSHTIMLGLFYTSGLRDYLVKIDFGMVGFFIYLLGIVLVSYIFYKLIELPLYQTAKSKL